MSSPIRLAREAIAALGLLTASTAALAAGQAHVMADGPADGTVISCVDIPVGNPRPPYGCFNLAHVSGLQLGNSAAVWYLYRFASQAAAEAARSPHGVVAAEAGAFWLSEITPQGHPPDAPKGGVLAAKIGPLALPQAAGYSATLAYAVMQPGQRSRIHTHPGPEAFYVVAGEQCVETPAGAKRAHAGEGFSEPAGIPMQLMATGSETRRGFALVLHDATQAQAAPSTWQPSNLCAL